MGVAATQLCYDFNLEEQEHTSNFFFYRATLSGLWGA